ncbi:MAG: asparagine synthase (glutamine-hydrolyzing), partial [Gemmatimonadota bacterium]
MCGIVGCAGPEPLRHRVPLELMRDAMAYRGPDGAGVWWSDDGRVGLAHRRLAIVGLGPAGAQPMCGAGGTTVITFNGELYNYHELAETLTGLGHRFHTGTDTEVLLASYQEWGEACLERFDGMFAFGLWDAERGGLFLARDRAGEKPLYWSLGAGGLRFASELHPLLLDPGQGRVLDPAAVKHYLAYAYAPIDQSLVEGIRKLPPAHALWYVPGGTAPRTWQWWRLPAHEPEREATDADLESELEHLLRESIRRRLIADVPVGILLSGGLDSSLITALAAGQGATVRTFTIRFPGHGRFDETEHARLIARTFGTEHVEAEADPPSEAAVQDLLSGMDEAVGDSSLLPMHLVSRIARAHVPAVLGGEGGDELFGGYGHHHWLNRTAALRRTIPQSWRAGLRGIAARLPVGFRGRHQLAGLAGDDASAIAHSDLYLDADARRELLTPATLRWLDASPIPEAVRAARVRPLGGISRRARIDDFLGYLPGDILAKVDRASMRTSLEVRAPFLDHHVIELAFGRLPDRLATGPTGGKVLLKALARRLLPAGFAAHRKQGFSIPIDAWLAGGWRNVLAEPLADGGAAYLRGGAVSRLLAPASRIRSNGKRV